MAGVGEAKFVFGMAFIETFGDFFVRDFVVEPIKINRQKRAVQAVTRTDKR